MRAGLLQTTWQCFGVHRTKELAADKTVRAPRMAGCTPAALSLEAMFIASQKSFPSDDFCTFL
jgi:hypothetical protein